MCGLEIKLDDRPEGRTDILSIRGDEKDEFSQGHVCPKATALQDLYEDPDRLRHPMKRVGRGEHATWEPMSWDDALDYAAQGIHAAQERHGKGALALYFGNPNAHNLGAMLYGPWMLRAMQTKQRFSATSVDQLPHMFASLKMFGSQVLFPIPDLDRTDLFFMIGANPMASNGSIMTAPGMRRRLREIQARGGRVVVIDPRRTETADVADEHQFIRPGTDAYFLLAMVNELFAQNLVDLGRFAPVCDGLEEVREAVAPFTAERAAKRTGIAVATIRRLAREIGMTERAAVYGRVGACTQEFGGLNAWAINLLNLLTGHFDRPGGVMFPNPAIDIVDAANGFGLGRGSFGRWRSRVRNLPEFNGELPASVMAEEMLTPGEGQIRALVTMAGNPVLSTPNGAQLDKAIEDLDFVVSIDPYLNETTRHADVILPPVSPLERDHYDLIFHAVAVRNTAKFSPAVIPKPAGAKHDWEIILGLTRRVEILRGGQLGKRTLQVRAFEQLGPRAIVDAGLRLGPYGAGVAGIKPKRFGQPGKLTLKVLLQHPHGIDLGALHPMMPDRLPKTAKGRIALAPECFLGDLDRLDTAEAHEGLLLIGRRHVRSNNSWMHNAPRLMRGKSRCTLMMHPKDAEPLGIANGDGVRVTSRVGSVETQAEITDQVMPGVVSLPHGFGHGRKGIRQRVAQEKPGVSMNDLTDHEQLDALTGTAAINGVPVTVARLEDTAEAAE